MFQNPAFLRRIAAEEAPLTQDQDMEDTAGMVAVALQLPKWKPAAPKLPWTHIPPSPPPPTMKTVKILARKPL